MDNHWAFDLENDIYTTIKTRALKKLKDRYPNIFFTQTDLPKDAAEESDHFLLALVFWHISKDATVKYPTVYLRELGGSPEQGRTLEGKDINGVWFTMQCDVTTNKSKKEARAVNEEVALLFKDIGFAIVAFPESSTVGNNYVSGMRVRRMFGSKDTK